MKTLPFAHTIFAGSSERASIFGEGGTYGPGLFQDVCLRSTLEYIDRFDLLTLLRSNQLDLKLLVR